MKQLVILAVWIASCIPVRAMPGEFESILFRIEPSFSAGVMVSMTRLQNGEIYCAVYTLPLTDEGQITSHKESILVKEVTVAAEDFDLLSRDLESSKLRSDAESGPVPGTDGDYWIFRRKMGGRSVEMQFWCPQASSSAHSLGMRLLKVAQAQDLFPSQEPAQPASPSNAG